MKIYLYNSELENVLFFFCYLVVFLLFFFFQAEDGIRDWSVTGVQTCALPILLFFHFLQFPEQFFFLFQFSAISLLKFQQLFRVVTKRFSQHVARSEERRVGKECRSRWWPDY